MTAFGVTVLVLLGMSMYFLARPQLVSFLFAVILLRLLSRWRESGHGIPWVVVLLFLVWANVHPGFLAGIIILAAYAAGDLASAWTASEPGRRTELLSLFRRSSLLLAACVLVALVNPYGFRLYTHIFSFLSDSSVLAHVNEYKVVDFRTGPGRMFELMLFLSAPAAVSRLLKREFITPALFLLWAHLALTAQRNIPFFMIGMAAPVAIWLEEMVAALRLAHTENSVIEPGRAANEGHIFRFPLLSVLVMAWIFILIRTPGSPPKFRPEWDASLYPAQAIAAVRQLGPNARIATTDIWGGYLIYQMYPDVHVFWDGRTDFYGSAYNLAALDAFMGRPGWDKTLAKNRITAVLVPVDEPLVSLLNQSGDWHVAYRDEVAILYQLSSTSVAGEETRKVAESRAAARFDSR